MVKKYVNSRKQNQWKTRNYMSLLCVFYIDDFQKPFRRDNLKSGGGGIIVYVRNDIIAKRRTNLEINDIDCLWSEISPRKGKSFLVGSFYRNPNEKSEWLNRFEVLIENVLLENKEIIILGDFNKDLLNLSVNNEWSNFITSFGLSQLISEPTQVTNTTKTHISNGKTVSSACVKMGISDYFAVACYRKINFGMG